MKNIAYRIEKKYTGWQLFIVMPNGNEVWVATRQTEQELKDLLGK